jgi:protein-disulfide isomerase
VPSDNQRTPLLRGRLLDILTLAVVGGAIFALVSPGSALHARYSSWAERRAQREVIVRHWDELVAQAMPLGDAREPEIIEFIDYECSYCRAFAAAVDSVVATGVAVAIVHLPLTIHPLASDAARAAICAGQLGRFPEVHRLLLKNGDWFQGEGWTTAAKYAVELGDRRLEMCMQDPLTDAVLAKHQALASALGVGGTPSFIAKHRMLAGPPTAAALIQFAKGQ